MNLNPNALTLWLFGLSAGFAIGNHQGAGVEGAAIGFAAMTGFTVLVSMFSK